MVIEISEDFIIENQQQTVQERNTVGICIAEENQEKQTKSHFLETYSHVIIILMIPT